ncbi:MAG: response regulator transcription factor [Clostridia bacterium]|nr:response regulator transcription factor [Clostridia bacterium]
MVNALLIENEERLVSLIEEMLLRFCPQVIISGKLDSIKNSGTQISDADPELLFVDIEKTYALGVDVVNYFNAVKFEVIFITATAHYALEAIKCQAAGFLLKPVKKEELIFAVNNAIKRITEKKENSHNKLVIKNLKNQPSDCDLLGIPTMEGLEFISIKDIIRCEGQQKCTRVVIKDRADIVSSYNLGEFRKLLEPQGFYSPHKSHLINLNYIRKYHKEGNIMLVNNTFVPVAKRKKQEFMNQVKHI